MISRFRLAALLGAAVSSAALIGAPSLVAGGPSFVQTPQAPPTPPTPPAAKAPRAGVWSRSGSGYGVGVGMGSGSYLGVDVQEVTPERVSALKLKEERGVEIVMVDQDAPAGRAGLKEHDVIMDFNGNRVEGEEQLLRMIHETPAGRQVTLGIIRDSQPMQIKVTLGDRRTLTRNFHVAPMPPMPTVVMPELDIPSIEVISRTYVRSAGMMVDNLTPQLGEFFGVKAGQGVLVRSVEKGSAAEAAGLKAGDVIVKVDNEKINDRNDFSRALRNRGGAKLALSIVREKREQTLELTLPARSKNQSFMVWPGSIRDASDFDFDMEFEGPDMEQLQKELPKIRQEIERIGPEIQRELERVRTELTRSMVEQQRYSSQRNKAEIDRINQRTRQQIEKVKAKIRSLQMEAI
jgi:serine protease Do